MGNYYEGLTQAVVDSIHDRQAMLADLKEKTKELMAGLRKESQERRDRVAEQLAGFKKEDEHRAAEVKKLCGEADKMAQGFRQESAPSEPAPTHGRAKPAARKKGRR